MIRRTSIRMAGSATKGSSISNMMDTKPLSYSFPPIAKSDATCLILGSMPGAESLRQQQYYAHPRNTFWPIMATLFGFSMEWQYQTRCNYLANHGVAVWDVLKACHRPGSLDQHIDPDTIEANDFNQFLAQHSAIKAIFFNGAKAEQVFQHHVYPNLPASMLALTMLRLPSTSPAHAAMSLEQKLAAWQVITDY